MEPIPEGPCDKNFDLNFDEEFLTCAVCLKLYKDPKILPCLHTFCSSCLENLANSNGGSRLICPVCRKELELPSPAWSGGVGLLSSNFYVASLLDFRKLIHSKRSPVQCQVCKSGRKVSALCEDCDFLGLCNRCVTVHKGDFQDHIIAPLNNLKNLTPRLQLQNAGQQICPRHPSQPTTFYCEPCATLVCRDCTVDKHRPGEEHDPREVSTVAPRYRASVEGLMRKTGEVICKINQQVESLDRGLTTTENNCKAVEGKIQEMLSKLHRVKENRKYELMSRKEEKEKELGQIKKDLAFCQEVLGRDDDLELLSIAPVMKKRLQQHATQQAGNRTFGDHTAVSFQPSGLSKVFGSLSVLPLFDVKGPIVESVLCSVTATLFVSDVDSAGGDIAPQIEVTSPQGKTTLMQTTEELRNDAPLKKGQTSRVSRVWGAKWRPQESGTHTLGVCMGDKREEGSVTVDVGCNNPVLRYGERGMNKRQFDRPMDVAVRGDRLYVADTYNHRIQVHDQDGKFRYLFLPTTVGQSGTCNARQAITGSIAVQADGTIVVRSLMEVMKFSCKGELLHRFFLDEFCTRPSGLAVQRGGRVLVADREKHSIFLFEADGTLVKQVGGWGQGEGQFKRPLYLCVDNEDNVIVSDKGNDRVQVFNKNLNFRHKFGQKGRQPWDMWSPTGVSADSRGNIVLANLGGTIDGVGHSEKLQVFRSDGTWVSTISSEGDKLNLPSGVAVTEDGHVFVADSGDHCIRKYRYM